jgi:RNA polymerase sigma-70 factor (ECF subfamily)
MDWSASEEACDDDVAAAQAGDEAAFARLFRATQPGLLRYAYVLAGDTAEDVCGEAWAQACRDLGTFRGDLDAFKGWVARIARNRAIDQHRARARRPAEPAAPWDLPETHDPMTSEDLAIGNISTAEALRAIASLPAEQAEAIMLRTVLGLDAKTTAAVLGRRPGAVRTASYRGLRTLARRFQDSGADEPS